ncbi:MAG: DUF4443 domain-containing protein [Candidatus Bathyarchaeia archaeon]
MDVKKVLEGLTGERAAGPSPSFSVFHVVKALELMAAKPIGRGKLSEVLNIGEGATRTLINRLKDAVLVDVSKEGCFLTSEGEKLWKEFLSIFPRKARLENIDLALANHNVAILVKGCGDKIRVGIEQRDAAIKVGAKGAVTLVFQNNKLCMPEISEDLAKDFPLTDKQLKKLLSPEEKDVIVIGSAETSEKAEYGAFAAAWTLLSENCD